MALVAHRLAGLPLHLLTRWTFRVRCGVDSVRHLECIYLSLVFLFENIHLLPQQVGKAEVLACAEGDAGWVLLGVVERKWETRPRLCFRGPPCASHTLKFRTSLPMQAPSQTGAKRRQILPFPVAMLGTVFSLDPVICGQEWQ